MQITNAQWTDASRTMVRAEIDGALSFIPADPTGNAHFAHLVATGAVIADAVADEIASVDLEVPSEEPAEPTVEAEAEARPKRRSKAPVTD